MPSLDVTRVLGNPRFADLIDVIRQAETVDAHGMAVFTPQTIKNVSAVVTQRSGSILRRETAGERVEGEIAIYTMFRLTDGRDPTRSSDTHLSADVVIYPAGDGNKYTVANVQNYSRFGAGFVVARCELLPVEPAV